MRKADGPRGSRGPFLVAPFLVAPAALHPLVLEWFCDHARVLPWRSTRDPYRVLVAEVLAQQTQAKRAAEGFLRFLAAFPDVRSLADATGGDVLRVWQGLGYNRRALALRAASQAVVAAGGWPDTVAGLERLPGVGPYTARAVACFALGLDVAPVDTNVARVLARALLGEDPGALGAAARQGLADAALPHGQAWAWSSALMDVGSAHCRPQPRCAGCPLEARCAWRALGSAAPLPVPRRAEPFPTSDRRWRGAVLRALAPTPVGMPLDSLFDVVGADDAGRPEGWFPALVRRLEAEGLVESDRGVVRLPGGAAQTTNVPPVRQ